jgi:hypothetical protein
LRGKTGHAAVAAVAAAGVIVQVRGGARICCDGYASGVDGGPEAF